MSTRSRIGMANPDGTISSIYCHFDGYIEGPDGVGYKLFKHYQGAEKIKALIALGDISSLGENIEEGSTEAYNRDRSEADCEALPSANVEDLLKINSGQEYTYLFDGAWRVYNHHNPKLGWRDLTVAVTTERLFA